MENSVCMAKKTGKSNQKKASPTKTITIRGVNTQVYDDYAQYMKQININMGYAITKIMQDTLEAMTHPDKSLPLTTEQIELAIKDLVPRKRIKIEDKPEIIISRKDLVDLNRRVVIQDTVYLRFEPDVTSDDLERYIEKIENIKKLEFPVSVPKLLVMSLTDLCENIIYYD